MTFGNAVSTCLQKYVTFDGRASRSEYWWFYLFTVLISALGVVIESITGMGIFSTLLSLAIFLPSLAVGIRRCHDSNHSGWWIICPIYNIVLMFLPGTEGENDYGTLEEESEEVL